jgi:hypothetical protein
MKSERIMRTIGTLIVVAAVVMVALYGAGVFNKKTVPAASGNNAPGYHPGTHRSNIGGPGGMEKHLLG